MYSLGRLSGSRKFLRLCVGGGGVSNTIQFNTMKEIAAYALLVCGGNENPSADQVKSVITAAGGEADEESLTKLLADLEGKDIHELLAEGQKKLKTCVSGGGGGGVFLLFEDRGANIF